MPQTILDLTADISQIKKSLGEIKTLLKGIDTNAKSTGKSVEKSFAGASIRIKQNVQDIKELSEKLKTASNKDAVLFKRRIAEASVELSKLGVKGKAALIKVQQEVLKTNATVKTMNTSVGRSSILMTRLKSTLFTMFGVFGAIRLIKNTVDIVKDFEAGMASVRAITGAAGEDLERLSNIAKNMGGIFSPTEITTLEVKLAKLGFTISEIANMAEGIVNLATATGENLGTAAELTASTIRGLGLDASETGMVVDQLGKSFVSSGLDINKYRESIKFIAPIAKDMGIELSSIVGILGKLADRQIFGSLAGTAFRRILIRMADSSSNLSKKLGFTVKSSEDLIRAFVQLKEQGTSFEELLTLVDVRSLTATSAIIDNADALKDYIEEIKNANGAIKEMAGIQLTTLSNKLKALNTDWNSFVLSLDDGDGALSGLLKDFVDLGTNIINAARAYDIFTDAQNRSRSDREELSKISKERIKRLREERRLGKLTTDELKQELVLANDKVRFAELAFSAEKLKFGQQADIGKLIEDQAAGQIDNAAQLLTAFKNIIKTEEDRVKIQDLINKKASEELNVKEKIFKGDEAELLKVAKKRLQFELDIATRKAKLLDDEFERAISIAKAKAIFDKEMANLEELTSIQVAEKKRLIAEQLSKDLETIEEKRRAKELKELEERLSQSEKIAKQQFATRVEEMKAAGADEDLIKKHQILLETRLLKLRIASLKAFGADPQIIAELSAELNTLGAALDGVVESLDEIEEIIDPESFEETFNAVVGVMGQLTSVISGFADEQVRATDRIVDDLNRRYSETQSALTAELALNEQGFASNVALRQAELADINSKRDQALKDQQEALKQQQQIESVSQAISLTSAAANIFKVLSSAGPLGILGAVGAVGVMYALFSSLKKDATDVTKYKKGGWDVLQGASHENGGINIGGGKEAEGGEIMSIFNKGASRKHKHLITNFTDMVNSGNVKLDYDLPNGMPTGISVNSNVSLDKSKQISSMNELLKKSLKRDSITYGNGYRIEKSGNRIRKIREN